tara:strand:+ start:1302 stop:1946 length:645 start_codon:yes stop_codon:yes gene_type:complete
MSNLSKRIITSFFLVLLLLLSSKSIFILSIILIFIIYQMFYEFYFLLSNIYLKNKIRIYLLSLFILMLLIAINYKVWLIFYLDDTVQIKLFFFIITVCISTDIGGYLFGKLFKGKKLTKISPNKTISGLYGSYFLSIFLSLIFFKGLYENYIIIIISFIISTISQLGDLFVSYLKRRANLKDTGKIFPGHGGILDRLDGIIFALPLGQIVLSVI